jgi:CHAT domain-containing protein
MFRRFRRRSSGSEAIKSLAELLGQAIESGRTAVRETARDDPSYLAALSHLGNALLEEFMRSGEVAGLTEAAECHQKVVRQLPPGHPELTSTLGNLGNVLLLKAQQSDETARPTALAVAMPQTPGEGDLRKAAEEAEYVAARVPGTEVLKGAEATSTAVRDALARHAWAHFACHAVSSPLDAAGAQLLLHDYQDRPLTVRDIAALRNDRAELAYLSACDTAHGPAKLADEAIHLTGTFHLAGYTHVIGTLWSIADPIAVEVARSVYDDITSPVPDAGRTAEALHKAIRTVRDRSPDIPALWAAHIHVGP